MNKPVTSTLEAPTAVQKKFTNWLAFGKAGLAPVRVKCQAYPRGGPYRDMSCHTNIPINIPTIQTHVTGCQGEFMLFVRTTDNPKASVMWGDLDASVLEAQDLRCAACDAIVRFHPTAMLPHCRPHRGMTRQAYQELQRACPKATGFFNVKLGSGQSPQTTEDGDEFESSDE